MVEQWKKEKCTKKESVIEKLKVLEQQKSLYKGSVERHKNIER